MDEGKETTEIDIRKEQLRIIFMQAPISNVVAILISFLCFFILNDYLDTFKLSVWTSSITLIAIYRLWLWRQYKQKPNYCTVDSWLNRYTIASALQGVVWCLIYLLANASLNLILMGTLLMLYLGVTVTAYSILTIHLPAYFSYTIPASIILPVTLARFEEPIFSAIALAIVVFYIMLGFFAQNTNKNQIETISQKINNQSLVDELKLELHQRDMLVEEKTEQLQSLNQALFQSGDQLKKVINGANLGYWDWDYPSGNHEVNDRWLEMLGLEPSDIKNDVSDWSERLHPEDKERMTNLIERHIKNHTSYAADFRMKHKDGHWVWVQGSGAVVEYHEETNNPIRLCGTHEDISHRKELEKKLEHQATHDELTGLLNRVQLWRLLDMEVSRAKRYNHDLSLLLIDLDYFKKVNDRYGHKIGDTVLCKFTEILLDQVRQTDFAIRYGGEEFVVLLPETPLKEAEDLSERLRKRVSESKPLPDLELLKITISVGIATFPIHGKSPKELLDIADKAMYQAKQDGRNLVKIGQGVELKD